MPESEKTYALAVETSGRVGSVAIGCGGSVLAESSFSGFRKHSSELFDTLHALTNQAGIGPDQVDHLYFTAGPGSFTGIRIAVTLAKMLSYAAGTRIVALDTLDVLVENATDFLNTTHSDLRRMAVVLDAKQNRFFAAVYERRDDCWKKLCPSGLLYPDDVLAYINKDGIRTGLLGEGLTYYSKDFASPLTEVIDASYWVPAARHVYALGQRMAQLGRFSDIDTLVPAYIRKPDAVEKREQTI